jgi:hypothetical protein
LHRVLGARVVVQHAVGDTFASRRVTFIGVLERGGIVCRQAPDEFCVHSLSDFP